MYRKYAIKAINLVGAHYMDVARFNAEKLKQEQPAIHSSFSALRPDVDIDPSTRLDPNVYAAGRLKIGKNSVVLDCRFLGDCEIGDNCVVIGARCNRVKIGDGSLVFCSGLTDTTLGELSIVLHSYLVNVTAGARLRTFFSGMIGARVGIGLVLFCFCSRVAVSSRLNRKRVAKHMEYMFHAPLHLGFQKTCDLPPVPVLCFGNYCTVIGRHSLEELFTCVSTALASWPDSAAEHKPPPANDVLAVLESATTAPSEYEGRLRGCAAYKDACVIACPCSREKPLLVRDEAMLLLNSGACPMFLPYGVVGKGAVFFSCAENNMFEINMAENSRVYIRPRQLNFKGRLLVAEKSSAMFVNPMMFDSDRRHTTINVKGRMTI